MMREMTMTEGLPLISSFAACLENFGEILVSMNYPVVLTMLKYARGLLELWKEIFFQPYIKIRIWVKKVTYH